jgi:hypothetical protein
LFFESIKRKTLAGCGGTTPIIPATQEGEAGSLQVKEDSLDKLVRHYHKTSTLPIYTKGKGQVVECLLWVQSPIPGEGKKSGGEDMGVIAHVCNPRYAGDGDPEDLHSSRSA